MKQGRRLGAPVLVALLVAVLLSLPGGGEKVAAAVERRVTVTQSIMIPAAAFLPIRTTAHYQNAGTLLWTNTGGEFVASLSFPVPIVNIKRITLYAFDSGPGGRVCMALYRTRPTEGSEDTAGEVCSADSATDPGVVYTTALNPRRVSTATQGAVLYATMFGAVGFRGVKVTFTYDTGA